jgi:hypothetical protein
MRLLENRSRDFLYLQRERGACRAGTAHNAASDTATTDGRRVLNRLCVCGFIACRIGSRRVDSGYGFIGLVD